MLTPKGLLCVDCVWYCRGQNSKVVLMFSRVNLHLIKAAREQQLCRLSPRSSPLPRVDAAPQPTPQTPARPRRRCALTYRKRCNEALLERYRSFVGCSAVRLLRSLLLACPRVHLPGRARGHPGCPWVRTTRMSPGSAQRLPGGQHRRVSGLAAGSPQALQERKWAGGGTNLGPQNWASPLPSRWRDPGHA